MSNAAEDLFDEQEAREYLFDEQEPQEAMEESVHDHALQLLFEEAMEESVHDHALQLLLEEVVSACPLQPLQIREAQIQSEFADAHSSSDSNASPSTAPAEVFSPNNASRIGKEGVEGNEDSLLMKQLCRICLEDKYPSEFFDSMVCSHRFCCTCITLHIRTKLQENLVSIDCPEPDCSEHLTPEQCVVILPKQTFEDWSLALVEASIPPSQKFYCPFQDCSATLVKDTVPDEVGCSNGEAAVVTKESKCPECRRLFCAQCAVPWHGGLDCSELQRLSDSEREEFDLMLFKLAKENEWQRCASCKHIIERNSGCCHMTCRCGYQFCYKCGSEWYKNGVSCNCSG